MAKSRCQCNILWIFRGIFSSFICLKTVFFCYCFRLTCSLIYFLFIDLYNILNILSTKWKFHINKDFLVNLQCEIFKFFCYMNISFLPQNEDKLNIWLKQTSQKPIMYLKPSEQQLFGRNLGCYLHFFQYQIRCYRCIFKFPNTKIRESIPCATLVCCTTYQHSTMRRVK